MSKAYDRMKEGLTEALSVARGDQPAASIHLNGHTYVPKAELDEALRRYDERNRTAQDRAVSNGLKLERIAKLESELAACKIALEQAWESNRERQAEIERLIQKVESHRLIQKKYKNSRDNARYGARAVDQGLRHWRAKAEELAAENERLVRNAQTEAWLLAGYHRICERHGIAPSSAELIAAAKEVENEGRA